jgi:hypothetical protein
MRDVCISGELDMYFKEELSVQCGASSLRNLTSHVPSPIFGINIQTSKNEPVIATFTHVRGKGRTKKSCGLYASQKSRVGPI